MDERRGLLFWLVLAALVLFLTNSAILLFSDISNKEIWRHLLTLEGLFIDAVGAAIVLFPDLTGTRERLLPSDKIRKIDRAREAIFTDGGLKRPEHDGEIYDKIADIIAQNKELEQPPSSITLISATPWVIPEEDRILPGGNIAIIYENDEYEVIGNQVMVDGWINNFRQELTERYTQMPLRIGLGFLLLGFGIQLFSQLLAFL